MARASVATIRPQIRNYAELTSLEVEIAKAGGSLLILPVGACEQHGDALPLGTDTIRADHVAASVVEQLAEQVGPGRAFVLPALGYGISPHHRFLPGTISLDPRTFIDIVTTVAGSLADAGFTRMLVITGHGGNSAALGVAQQTMLAGHPDFIFAYSSVSTLATKAHAAMSRTEVTGHCGESETAQMLAIDESLVDAPRLTPGATTLAELSPRARLTRTKSPSSAVTFDQYSENGVLGDPRTATASAGKDILGEATDALIAYCRQLLDLSTT